ncbi:M20 family metallopeptidase [Nitratireductor aquimarinus]|uniref:M20 family metallopeptidase n=1 Tax=Nitratireductor aquimarinus TaxID=889300 RepID=UPI001A8CA3A8|nr:M20 family metallopeptidase [Nitratireductor aquimarinus]MBN8245662.1 M20 family metallopeptidase [Nitratireductor aquimarinus]MBY6134045.1 M20 family metallopeptidase [Nitratireductor aquimarinus]MCA1305141.1 M20 family metallopeptidase [Nitratireductor aquimarinus]
MRPASDFDTETLLAEILKWVSFETPSERPDLIDLLLDHVEALFEGLPVTRQRVPARDGRGGQLVLRYDPKRSNAAPTLFMGHIDTVWAAGTLNARPIRREDDKVFGPGIFDMKAGSCLATMTLLTLAREGILPPRPIVVYLNGDEETGSNVSRDTITDLGRNAAVILVPEPSFEAVGTVITARKGWGNFRIEATGVSAHAGGNLHDGRSAIREIAHHVIDIEQLTRTEPHATFNVGTISGGTRPNVVPEFCYAEIDMRADTQEDAERLTARLLRLDAYDPDVKLVVSGGINRPPFQRSAAVARLYEATKVLAEGLDLPLGETSRGGVSDGNLVACLGKPVLDGLGCSGAGAHALHEHILASTVAPRAALMFALATDPDFHGKF